MKQWEAVWFDILKNETKVGIGDKVIAEGIEELQERLKNEDDIDKRELDGIQGIRTFKDVLDSLHIKHKKEHEAGLRRERDVMRKNASSRMYGGRSSMMKLVSHLRKSKHINFPIELLSKNSFIIPTKEEWSNPYNQ